MNADKHFHASSVWNTKWWVGECKKCPQLWRKAAQNEKENMDNGNGTRGRLCDECIGLLAFLLGVCVTVLCFRLRQMNREDDQNNESEGIHGAD